LFNCYTNHRVLIHINYYFFSSFLTAIQLLVVMESILLYFIARYIVTCKKVSPVVGIDTQFLKGSVNWGVYNFEL
jgi:hypothetical protein